VSGFDRWGDGRSDLQFDMLEELKIHTLGSELEKSEKRKVSRAKKDRH